jgi:endonuclease/exonuclease/phosphatase family metal-dependent hydrolase
MKPQLIRALTVPAILWFQSVRVQIGALAGTYGLVTCIYLILRWQIGEQWQFIALSNNFLQWILLGSLVSFFASLLTLDKPFWILYNLPGVLMLVIWYGPLFLLGGSGEVQNGVLDLTVATYNVGGARQNREEIRDEILAMDADLVALQEAYSSFLVHLEGDYPNIIHVESIALVSRYPIVEQPFAVQEGDSANARVGAFRTLVMIDEQPVAVYVLHPARPELDLRRLEYDSEALDRVITQVAAQLEQEVYPVILLCDCNLSDKSDDYQLLARSLQDGWRQAGQGFGFTAPANNWYRIPFLLVRSDYIWFSPHFEIENIEVQPGLYSDHLPVWAKLVLVEPTPIGQ